MGGEIPTPTLDALARRGVMLTQFNTMPTCSPSRAALLTGRDPHRVGLGAMAELTAPNQRGQRGYEGYLIDGVPTLAGELRELGYATYLSGKWHLGDKLGRLPVDRGFDRSLAMLHAGADHMSMRGYSPQQPTAMYVEDERFVELPTPFYSSDLFVDRLIGFLGERVAAPAQPFFAWLAFTAPHSPLQAPDELLAAQGQRYEAGWDALRAARFERQRKLGLVSRDAQLPERWSFVPPWEQLDPGLHAREVRRMAAYGAMVEGLDRSLARLLEALRLRGELDDTVIVFISDNSAEASDFSQAPGVRDWFQANYDNATPNIGRDGSYVFPGSGWAQVSNVPNRLFKGLPTSGGTRVPAFVVAPGRYRAGGRVGVYTSILDLAPTLLEIAGGSLPDTDGRSLDALLRGKVRRVRRDGEGVAIELLGSAAYVEGDWKAVRLRAPWGSGRWELYDLKHDPGESRDVAAEHPQVTARLATSYEAYARRVGVIDIPADFQPYPVVFGPTGGMPESMRPPGMSPGMPPGGGPGGPPVRTR